MLTKHIVLGLGLINSVMGSSDYVSLFDFGTEQNPMPREDIFLSDIFSDFTGCKVKLQYQDGTYSEPKEIEFGGIRLLSKGKRVAKVLKELKGGFIVDITCGEPGTGGRSFADTGFRLDYLYKNCSHPDCKIIKEPFSQREYTHRGWAFFDEPAQFLELISLQHARQGRFKWA